MGIRLWCAVDFFSAFPLHNRLYRCPGHIGYEISSILEKMGSLIAYRLSKCHFKILCNHKLKNYMLTTDHFSFFTSSKRSKTLFSFTANLLQSVALG